MRSFLLSPALGSCASVGGWADLALVGPAISIEDEPFGNQRIDDGRRLMAEQLSLDANAPFAMVFPVPEGQGRHADLDCIFPGH